MTRDIGMRELKSLLRDHDAAEVRKIYGDRLERQAEGFLGDWEQLDRDVEAIQANLCIAPEFKLAEDFPGPDPVIAAVEESERSRSDKNEAKLKVPWQLLAVAALLVLFLLPLRDVEKGRVSDRPQPLANTQRGTGDSEQLTALFQAIAEGDVEKTRELSAQPHELAQRDEHGNTPLHLAAWENDPAIVSLFLEAGADIDARNDLDRTPLMQAAYRGNLATVTLLLEKGARPDVRDREGMTARQLAEAGEFHRVIQVFESHQESQKGPAND